MTWRKICAWHKSAKRQRLPTFTKMVCATEDRTQCILSEKPRCLWGFALAHSRWAPFHVAFPQHLVSKSHLHTMPWKNQPCSAGEKARVQDEKNIEKPCHAHCRLQNLQISGNYSSSCTWHFRIFMFCMTKPTIPTWRGMTKRPSSTARSQLWKSMKIQHAGRKS